MRLSILAVTFVAFTAYSLIVVAGQGYFGFLSLAWADPWGMQLFIDLCIALFLFTCWMIPDARSRGIPSWPYLLGILSLGSIGALAYLVHRELRKPADSGTDLTNFLSPAARTPELQPRAEKGSL